jgi:predicted ATP-binding protein involved in virulence
MRIDRLHIENFKKFSSQDFDFHPHFTLLVGDNGSGKTSVLDALAVAMGIWLVRPPDSEVRNSRRKILPSEIRLIPSQEGDRIQFREVTPATIRASGNIAGQDGIDWAQRSRGTSRTEVFRDWRAYQIIQAIYDRDRRGEKILCPVLAYYGAGRAWLPSNERVPKARKPNDQARRWAAFYDCFNERIRFAELRRWFLGETIAAGNRNGRMRPGFDVVKRAILRCLPEADGIWYDNDRQQIVFSIAGNAQPFDNLSAGQKMMLALVADLAIKAVTQNAYLLPPDELGPDHESLPKVLLETPGVVLIDELDVHLHPKWQRRVASDLKETFPCIQFICTSHSPQVIGEVKPEEVRSLDGGEVTTPTRSFGIDSSRVLEEVMDATSRNESVEALLRELFGLIDTENFNDARELLTKVEAQLGPDDPEVTRARALMTFLESKA